MKLVKLSDIIIVVREVEVEGDYGLMHFDNKDIARLSYIQRVLDNLDMNAVYGTSEHVYEQEKMINKAKRRIQSVKNHIKSNHNIMKIRKKEIGIGE